ncbi:MAG TPA: hypothetical protein VGG61_05470, partial [Gemmataceae bacterium]
MRGLIPFREILVALFNLVVFVAPPSFAADDVQTLDEYLNQYRDLGLPLPPNDAPLVRYESGGGGLINGEVDPIRYSLGFLLEPGTKKKRAKLLWGVSELQHHYDTHPKVIEPDPEAVKRIEEPANECLLIAIQCHSRGWDKLAKPFLEKFQKDGTRPARTVLTNRAWDYWEEQLTETGSDRAMINKRLKELMKADPNLDDKVHQYLLKSLELALVPSKAKQGSIEAMIDDLIEYGADTGTIGVFEPEDRYWRLARKGFEAVPALIEHLDDERLTRAKMIGFNNFRSFHLRVQHVVSDLLQGLAGDGAGRDWLRRQQGYVVEKDEAKKW